MRSHLLRLCALAVCLTLASCSNSTTRVIEPPRPLPAEYAVQCPPPVEQANNSADAAAVALKELYDQYGLCAGRLVDLVNYLQEKR